MEILFVKKNPLQDLLSSLNAVVSTNESPCIITGHVIYNSAYTYKFQLKTTIAASFGAKQMLENTTDFLPFFGTDFGFCSLIKPQLNFNKNYSEFSFSKLYGPIKGTETSYRSLFFRVFLHLTYVYI